LNYLNRLEQDSIYIIREAYTKISKMALLWSIGKDSTVLLWLCQKAFLGNVPFPLVHVDTSFKIPEMIAYRDKLAKEMDLNLIVGQNKEALDSGMNPELGRLTCCGALKTDGLNQVVNEHELQGLIVGIRRDEEGSRAKERVFSVRGKNSNWDVKNQAPEFWNQFQTDFKEGEHVRVHPLLQWTELDIWRYIKQENIPLINLYFSKNGKRYRSLGCYPCTSPIESEASTLDEIITELEETTVSERSGRAQDQVDKHAMEKLRVKGYM
jgi:sulfate adenylyltransferase subunit 2